MKTVWKNDRRKGRRKWMQDEIESLKKRYTACALSWSRRRRPSPRRSHVLCVLRRAFARFAALEIDRRPIYDQDEPSYPPDSAPGKNNRLVARSRGSCCREESCNGDESWLKRIVEVIGKLLLLYGDVGTGRRQWIYITACKVHRYEWSFCTMVHQNERWKEKKIQRYLIDSFGESW